MVGGGGGAGLFINLGPGRPLGAGDIRAGVWWKEGASPAGVWEESCQAKGAAWVQRPWVGGGLGQLRN